MLTADQVAILALAFVGMFPIFAVYLAVTDRATGGRHVADEDGVRPVAVKAEPPTMPMDRRERVPSSICFPGPRPFTGGIPILVVDGPPSTRGALPAKGIPVEVRPSCSFCRDGRVVMSASRTCPWCSGRGVE